MARLDRAARTKFGFGYWRKPYDSAHGIAWSNRPLATTTKFANEEREIAKQLAASLNPVKTLADLADRATAKEATARDVFRWGYATVLWARNRARVGIPYFITFPHLHPLFALECFLSAADPGGDYEYTRVRYIIDCAVRNRQDLTQLGLKLLSRRPHDDLLLWQLCAQLGMARDESTSKKALTLCDEVLSRRPTDLSFINLIVFTYESRWMSLGHKREDGLEMIKWARKYIALAPIDCPTDVDQQRRILITLKEPGGK